MRTKRLLLLIGSVCLALMLALPLVAACAGPAGPAPEAPMEPQEWNCIIYMPGITVFYDIEMQTAFDRIKERTGGLLDIKVVPNGVLPIKATDWIRAISAGELEMSLIGGAYHSGDYPMWGIIDVPYIFTDKFEKRLVWDAARPILQREMEKEGVHILKYRPAPNQCLSTSKPVDVMDMKGLKVRSYSKAISLIIETMGGTAVTMASSEIATALERGTIDGVLTTAGSILALGWTKPLPYTYDIKLLISIWAVAVNKGLWDALPKDVQNIVHEELDQYEGQSLMYAQLVEMPGVFEQMLAADAKSVEVVPPEFLELMREKVTKPLMAEEVEKAGAVGEEILRALEEVLGIKLR